MSTIPRFLLVEKVPCMMINVLHAHYSRMLEGDGFDYVRSDRPPPKAELSGAKESSMDDWSEKRRKLFAENKPKMSRMLDAARSSDKSDVSYQFSLLRNQALSSLHVFFSTSRNVILQQQYSDLFFLLMALIHTTWHQSVQSISGFWIFRITLHLLNLSVLRAKNRLIRINLTKTNRIWTEDNKNQSAASNFCGSSIGSRRTYVL